MRSLSYHSGPTKYDAVNLPDQEVITELTSRGQVSAPTLTIKPGAPNPPKTGPDNDGRSGRL
jgi:hypothetical protein